MQFSDTINLQGLIQDIDFRCSTDDNQYPINDKVRNINNAYDKVVEFAIRKGNKIKWADTNNTAPYNQNDYNVVSGSRNITIKEPFKFYKAQILLDSKWTDLELVDNITEDTVSGNPVKCKIDGDNLMLYPTPDYDKTNGLRIYSQEEPTLFDSSDTSDKPQLPRFAHPLLSIEASIDYCAMYKEERLDTLSSVRNELYTQLEEYLSDRDKTIARVTPNITSTK